MAPPLWDDAQSCTFWHRDTALPPASSLRGKKYGRYPEQAHYLHRLLSALIEVMAVLIVT